MQNMNVSQIVKHKAHDLVDLGVSPKDLYSLSMVGETIIGEVEGHVVPGKPCSVKNPKRLLRAQQRTRDGVAIVFALGSYDQVLAGTIRVNPSIVVPIKDLSDESKLEYYNLILDFFEGEKHARAVKSGIVTPEPSRIVKPR